MIIQFYLYIASNFPLIPPYQDGGSASARNRAVKFVCHNHTTAMLFTNGFIGKKNTISKTINKAVLGGGRGRSNPMVLKYL